MKSDYRFISCLIVVSLMGAFLAAMVCPVAADDTDDNSTISENSTAANVTSPPGNFREMNNRPLPGNGTYGNLTGNESHRMNSEYWQLPAFNLSANASDYNLTLPDAGLGPDNPMYSLKMMFENLDESLTTNSTDKIKKQLNHAENRLAEANTALDNDKSDAAQTALDNFNEEIATAQDMLADLPSDSKEYSELQKTIEKLQRILSQITQKMERVTATNGDNSKSGNGNGFSGQNGPENTRGLALNGTFDENQTLHEGNLTAPFGNGNMNSEGPGAENFGNSTRNQQMPAGNQTGMNGPGQGSGTSGNSNGNTNGNGNSQVSPNMNQNSQGNSQQGGNQIQKSSGNNAQNGGGQSSPGQSGSGTQSQGQQQLQNPGNGGGRR